MGVIGGPDGPTSFFPGSMGWVNVFGLVLIVLLMIPNIIYAIKRPGEKNKCQSRALNILEQIGRYGSMALMVVAIGPKEPGFASAGAFIVYLFGNATLMLVYWTCWVFYFKKPTLVCAVMLALVPALIFILSGVTLSNWLLVAFALLFAYAHMRVTLANAR